MAEVAHACGTDHRDTLRGHAFVQQVGASGRVYITGREGATVVLKNGTSFEQLAVNTLTDGFDASPALVDGEIYLRGYRYLYCVAAE